MQLRRPHAHRTARSEEEYGTGDTRGEEVKCHDLTVMALTRSIILIEMQIAGVIVLIPHA